jgi:hypothetical protein
VRFAWLRRNSVNDNSGKQGLTPPLNLIRFAYNAVFWIFLLPFFTAMAYGTGFIVFTIIIFVRLGANLYANNASIVTPEQYARFPFRA